MILRLGKSNARIFELVPEAIPTSTRIFPGLGSKNELDEATFSTTTLSIDFR
jgi:hypothetical protein